MFSIFIKNIFSMRILEIKKINVWLDAYVLYASTLILKILSGFFAYSFWKIYILSKIKGKTNS